MENHWSLSKAEITGSRQKCVILSSKTSNTMFTYPFKHGKDLLPKLLNFSFWSQHSIWEPLLLLNMKLLNIIGKHCGIENTSHLWEKNWIYLQWHCSSHNFRKEKKYPLDSSDRRVHSISQAIYQSLIAGENWYLKS